MSIRTNQTKYSADAAKEKRFPAWEKAAAAEGQRWLLVSAWIQIVSSGTVINGVVPVAME